MRRIITKRDLMASLQSVSTPSTLETGDFVDLSAKKPSTAVALPTEDNYVAKLVKLIPAEIVTAFVTIDSVIRSGNDRVSPTVYWWITAFLLVATPVYLWRVTQAPNLRPKVSQIILGTMSFGVWVFTLGGPFVYAKVGWYDPIYGALLLPLYTLLVPIIVRD